ncbi:MAG: UPF0182 family protein [Desulfobacterium sp.]|nr:UPF0182 family protein [Desulfobacterium sp.]
MRNLKNWALLLCSLIIVGGFFYLSFTFRSLDFFIDRWWFKSLGYEFYFWQRFLYKYVTFGGVIALFFVIFFFNFWIASRFLGSTSASDVNQKSYRKLIQMFRSGSMKIYFPLSIILAIPIALPFYQQWEKGLLFLFGKASGVKDPVFGHDISFYLFSFPFFKLIQNELLLISLLLLISIAFLYWIERRILKGKDQDFPAGAKIHVNLLLLFAVAIQVWGFVLQGYSLLYTDKHQPHFFGPGYTEMVIILPLIVCSTIFFICTAVSVVYYMAKGKGVKKIIIFGILLVISLLGTNSDFLSRQVEENLIEANAVAYEKPYIENNIKSTLAAYDLTRITKTRYDIEQTFNIIGNPGVRENLRNIPVWDRTLLDDVYKQIQGIKPYYNFHGVDVGRYNVSGRYQQVYLAPRELDLQNLPDSARTWQSRHLQYTHGYGIVMTPAAQGGDESMTWFLRDMPIKSDYGMQVTNPGIYYGLGQYDYAIVPNEEGEIDHPNDEANALIDYEGNGGIPLSSLFEKLLFAAYFQDRNIITTTKTMEKSRILFRRNIRDAIKVLTPFFHLDDDPYIVTTSKGLFWIQDAYTVSGLYPNAQPFEDKFNYIRNSVKIVVDAYNGSIDYYIASKNDPIIRTYDTIYPNLLKPLDTMDSELKQHLSYPKDLFGCQLAMYAEYHQPDPEMFYIHEDAWELPRLSSADQSVPMKPYHLTLNLIDPKKHEFMLLSPLSPIGRSNLSALAIAGCDGKNYGKIFIYTFPKGIQVYGPSQINTLIDQDTDISQQLTLWDQAGSEVIRGRMIILPIGKIVLYIQPVYLSSATRLKIPELKRLIVSQGEVVAMAASLEEAIESLEGKLEKRIERQKKRFPVATEQTAPVKTEAENLNDPMEKQEMEKQGKDSEVTAPAPEDPEKMDVNPPVENKDPVAEPSEDKMDTLGAEKEPSQEPEKVNTI